MSLVSHSRIRHSVLVQNQLHNILSAEARRGSTEVRVGKTNFGYFTSLRASAMPLGASAFKVFNRANPYLIIWSTSRDQSPPAFPQSQLPQLRAVSVPRR